VIWDRNTAIRPASVILHIALLLGAALWLLPLYVVVVTAFKPLHEVVRGSMLAWPEVWTLEPLHRAWSSACIGSICDGIVSGIENSLLITGPAAILSVTLGAITGYSLTRWSVPGAHAMFAMILVANVIPYQVILMPMTITLRTFGLFGTVGGLVLVHVVYGLPYMTLLFRNFFRGIPDELIRAARMDGGTFWSIFVYIVMPMSKPLFLVALVLQVTGIWNDYLFGLVFGGRHVPVMVMLGNLISSERGEKEYNVNMGGVLLAALPMLLLYLFAGRLFLRGLVAGPSGR
jgi:glucose/mannose transport system permease protein